MSAPGTQVSRGTRRIAVLAALALHAAACRPGQPNQGPDGPPPVVVEIATVATGPISRALDLVGQLQAEESVVVKPEARGLVEAVTFQEGDEVRKGQPLFRLRNDEQRARLREAESRLTLQKDEYERVKKLAANGTASPSELDRAFAAWQEAAARIDLARIELERTEVKAPFDGVLGARVVSPGDFVDRGTDLVRIDALSRLRLNFTVPEAAIGQVEVGMPVTLTVAPRAGERFSGEVYFVAPSVNERNRRLLFKAWVPNPERKLLPGLFANIRVEVEQHREATIVPESAVAYEAAGPFVWKVGPDGVAEKARVEVGLQRDGRVEIHSGVQAGDRIVSAGTHKVTAGARVQSAGGS